ncbi:MAG TPA: sugar diacid recognition domain-containing protein [Candidatus Acidoferrum sp.]|nr:sugar diacid recognition domain-containing protein [Candidatus Acidoferrum sp.]
MLSIDPGTAQELVDLIRSRTGYHAIICDTTGTIIADSARKRCGVVHAGAKRILTTALNFIAVTEADEAASQGKMKVGFNQAIKDGGAKIGSLGIAGPVSIVEPIVRISAGLIITLLRDKETAAKVQGHITEMYASLQKAAAAIEGLTASSKRLAETSQAAAALSGDAAREVQQTSEILDLIKRVAQQTRLLSFNAGIAAGRAGEFGKGFAVVAQEVRTLADESSQSATAIEQTLGKCREAVQQVLVNVRQNDAITQEQARSTQEIGRMIEGLREIGGGLVRAVKTNSELRAA